jgi:carboxymethylenebutenolidase
MNLPHSLVLAALFAVLAGQDPSPKGQDPKPAVQPPGDPVKQRLENSPRHQEWVELKQGERTLHCFVVFPEKKEKALAVLVIHENKGLTDWVRAVSDELAEAGYIAIAPDLLSGAGPGGGKTDSFSGNDAATQALYKLPPQQVTADLNAAADHATKLEAGNGKLAAIGFCWGGTQSFAFATARKDLRAALVFYGSAPKDETLLSKIECPVFGFYGENDARITEGVAATGELMKKLGKKFEPVVYPGAGHGFFRMGAAPEASAANKQAHAEAWTRVKALLSN